MMNSKIGLKRNKLNALIWLCVLLFALLLLAKDIRHLKIESSLTALLGNKSPIPSQVDHHLSSVINDAIIWLVGADKLETAKQSADQLSDLLNQLDNLTDIQAQNKQQQQDWQQYFFTHRAVLLTAQQKQALSQPDNYLAYIQSQLYSPFAAVSTNELQQDPLLLTRQKILQQKQQLQIDDGWLYTQYEGRFYILIRAKTIAQGIKQKAHLVEQLNQMQQQVEKQFDVKIYKRGAIFFSQSSAQSVERDITVIGTGSLIGIILLLLLFFRSISPLLLLICSLTTGMLFGLLATWLYFAEIHLLTLGLSSCLIGVSADYSLHFFVKRFYPDNSTHFDTQKSLGELKPSLIIAFITTALCYAVMLFVPLIILQQMAIFAIFGLLGALLTVILLYPLLTQTSRSLTLNYQNKIVNYLQKWHTVPYLVPILFLFFILSTVTALHVEVNDDVRLLQERQPELLHNEKIISHILQQNNELQYFIVQAETAEALLKNSLTLYTLLQQPNYIEQITPAISLENYIQDSATQQENYQLVAQTLKQLSPTLTALSPNIITKYPQQFINFTQFLNSNIGQTFHDLYQKHQGMHYLLVPLTKSNSELAKQIATQLTNISYHNITQEWSELFQQSREAVLYTLIFSCIIACLLLSWFLTWRDALAILAILIFSMSIAVASLTITGQRFNLFSALGLMLLLGMGIDYGVFMAKQKNNLLSTQQINYPTSSFIAIGLSALTTFLSFGLLALSKTQALVSFATILCIGIGCVFIFIPLILKVPTKVGKKC